MAVPKKKRLSILKGRWRGTTYARNTGVMRNSLASSLRGSLHMITGNGGSNTNIIKYSPSCFADLRVLSQEDYSHSDAVPLLKMLRWSSTVTQVFLENTYSKHEMLEESQMPLFYFNNGSPFIGGAEILSSPSVGTTLINHGFTQPLLVNLLVQSCVNMSGIWKKPTYLLTALTYKLLLPRLATHLYSPVSGVARYVPVKGNNTGNLSVRAGSAPDLNAGKIPGGSLTHLASHSELSNELWFCAFGFFESPSRSIEFYRGGTGVRSMGVGDVMGFKHSQIIGWPTAWYDSFLAFRVSHCPAPITHQDRYAPEAWIEEEPEVLTTALVLFDPTAGPIDVSNAHLYVTPVDNLFFSLEVLEAFYLWSSCLVFLKQSFALLGDHSAFGYVFGAIKHSGSKLLTKATNHRDNLVVLDAVTSVTSRRYTALAQTWILWADVSQQRSTAERSLVLHTPFTCGLLLADRRKYTRPAATSYTKFPNIFFGFIRSMRQAHNVCKWRGSPRDFVRSSGVNILIDVYFRYLFFKYRFDCKYNGLRRIIHIRNNLLPISWGLMRRRVSFLRYSGARSRDFYFDFRRFESVRRLPLASAAILYAQFFFSPFSDYFYRVSQVSSNALYYGTVPVSKNLSAYMASVSYYFCRFTEPYFGRFKQSTLFDRQLAGVLSYRVKLSSSMVQRLTANFAEMTSLDTPAGACARCLRSVLWRSSSEKGLRRFSKFRQRYMRRFNTFSLAPRHMFLRSYAASFRKYEFTLLHRASYALWVWNLFLVEGGSWAEGSSNRQVQSDLIGDIGRSLTLAFTRTKKQLNSWFMSKFGDKNPQPEENSDQEDSVEADIYDEGFMHIGLLRQRLLLKNVSRCDNAASPQLFAGQRPEFRASGSLALFEVWQNFVCASDLLLSAEYSHQQDWLCFLYNGKHMPWLNNFQYSSSFDDIFGTSCSVPTKMEAIPQISLSVYWDNRMEISDDRLRTLSFACENGLTLGALYSVGTLPDGTSVVVDNPCIVQHSELSAYKATLWEYAIADVEFPTYGQDMSYHSALSKYRLHLYGVSVSESLNGAISCSVHERVLA